MLFKRRKPKITREEAMAAHPVRNPAVEWGDRPSGGVLIVVRPRKDRFGKILRWIVPPPPARQIELDELGSEVWRLCTGALSVKQIVRSMAKKHKLNHKEAEVSTTEYLRQLGKRGLVGLATVTPVDGTGEVATDVLAIQEKE